MEIKTELLPPIMPNSLPIKVRHGLKQDGFKINYDRVPVKNLSDSEAMEYGELMKQAFIEHHRKLKSK